MIKMVYIKQQNKNMFEENWKNKMKILKIVKILESEKKKSK